MAIGVGPSTSSLASLSIGRGGAEQNSGATALGLRGVASVGSGLRTGITVVDHALRTAAELEQARQRAREAIAEQARLESETASAEDAARRAEVASESAAADGTEPRPADATASGAATVPDDDAARLTIQAAVAAGEAGDVAPRGSFLDFSI